MMILLLLVLCICLPAGAEEPVSEVVSGENEPVSFPDQVSDLPAEEGFVQPAQEGPEAKITEGHTPDHGTWELLHGQSDCLSIGSPDAHYVKRTYDLYCGVCQRVVAENYRTEEVNEPHALAVQSRILPTCVAPGEETLFCVQCGDTVAHALPIVEHTWEPWDEASGVRRCTVCGLEERRDIPTPSGHDEETTENPPAPDPIQSENPPAQGHSDAHEMRETLNAQPMYHSLGSQDGHRVIRQYDLVCLDCQQVIQEACRAEDVTEPHSFQLLSRTAPTCIQEGEERLHCPLCGDSYTNVLPLTDHEWGPWTVVAGNEQVLTRFCQNCGIQETKPVSDESGNEPAQEPTDKPTDEPAEQPVQEHNAEHPTYEIPSGEPVYQSLGEPDTHRVIRRYDLFCETCQCVVEESCRIDETDEYHVLTLQNTTPATCIQEGTQTVQCSLCGYQRTDAVPLTDHTWTEWTDTAVSDVPSCQRDQVLTRRCQVCGLEQTNVIPAGGHQWQAVSYIEATCTQDGTAVRRCALCGEEETISLPAYGHTYVHTDMQDGSGGKDVCALCGAEKETQQEQKQQSHMYYNNTVTSFGPTTRELIGGSVWNRVTPVDLSEEGVFTYPLVASNQYTVGTATLVNGQDSQEVKYKLSSPKINVHSESLVVYPDLEALKTGSHAVSFEFNEPIDLKSIFGKDARVIVAITLKADYDADSIGVGRFWPDQNWIDQMMNMIK